MELTLLLGQAIDNSNENEFNWPLAVFLVGFFLAFAIVVSVALWQGLATWRARMSIARERAYAALADKAVHAEEETLRSLRSVLAELAEIRQCTAEVERLMKEVG